MIGHRSPGHGRSSIERIDPHMPARLRVWPPAAPRSFAVATLRAATGLMEMPPCAASRRRAGPPAC